MGIFKQPQAASPPPPLPIPPAANPPSMASSSIASANAVARTRARGQEGSGFNGTDLTKPGLAGSVPTAQVALTGGSGAK